MRGKHDLNPRHFVTALFVAALGVRLFGYLSDLRLFSGESAGDKILLSAMETGSANAVTAVVTWFRGFDTLGEVAVLFLASSGVGLLLSFGTRRTKLYIEPNFMLRTGSSYLFPLILLFGVYVVVHGHLSPGGGFQGGVIIASAFLLLYLSRASVRLDHSVLTILESGAGIAYVLLGLAGLWIGGKFLANILPHSQSHIGELVSGGVIPIIYILVGIKVGSEMSFVIEKLIERSKDD